MTTISLERDHLDPHIVERLMRWHRTRNRDFPWRHTRDAYRLTVSELMLVRTRAEQVASIWPSFFLMFPTLEALASAPSDVVTGAIRPLGLARRGKKVVDFARAARATEDWERLIDRLPGGGPYVAAAVAIGHRVADTSPST